MFTFLDIRKYARRPGLEIATILVAYAPEM